MLGQYKWSLKENVVNFLNVYIDSNLYLFTPYILKFWASSHNKGALIFLMN